MKFYQPIPLSLYVHYPWCIQKCPYCDFNSHTQRAEDENAYIEAMIKQLEKTLPMVWGRPIQSIFFGGGTPSLISEKGLDKFMSHARALLGFKSDIEITLEANPGTVDFKKFAGFHQAGINRLSIGIQSFADKKLQDLGRIHSATESGLAIEAAKSAGFDNFNLDLMFALPNQTLEEAVLDIETALSFRPSHLSHYQLTLEPNTPFYKNPPILPEDDLSWDMQLACHKKLAAAGFEHYEVSGFTRPGKNSRHNLNYWQFGDYIGLGAGAHGKITDAPQGKIWRTQMPASPGGYVEMIQQGKMGRQNLVDDSEAVFEFMLNALRLQAGFDLSLFELRAGLTLNSWSKEMKTMQAKGWVNLSGSHLQLTKLGKTYLNEVLQLFLP